MDLMTEIRNKLIVYKNYGGLSKQKVSEIQEALLNLRKEEDFVRFLEEIEKGIKK